MKHQDFRKQNGGETLINQIVETCPYSKNKTNLKTVKSVKSPWFWRTSPLF